MEKYSLERGIRGSEAKYKSIAKFYRDTFEQIQELKQEAGEFQQQKEEGVQAVRGLQEKEAWNNTALGVEKALKEARKYALEGIGSFEGNSKAKNTGLKRGYCKAGTKGDCGKGQVHFGKRQSDCYPERQNG